MSSRNLPFHSPQTSQLGNPPTWYRPPQSHGSAISLTWTACMVRSSSWIAASNGKLYPALHSQSNISDKMVAGYSWHAGCRNSPKHLSQFWQDSSMRGFWGTGTGSGKRCRDKNRFILGTGKERCVSSRMNTVCCVCKQATMESTALADMVAHLLPL